MKRNLNEAFPERDTHFPSLTSKHRAVFRMVHTVPEVSRAMIGQELRMNNSSVSYLVNQMIEWGLLADGERVPVPRGQPIIRLEIDRTTFFQFGISIYPDRFSIARTNLAGEQMSFFEFKGDWTQPQATCVEIADRLRNQMEIESLDPAYAIGVGVAMSGNVVNYGEYLITPDPLLHWSGYKTAESLSSLTRLPVFIENDAKAAALGELVTGEGKEIASFYYTSMGLGLGGAYVENQRIIRGAGGNLGELGALLTFRSVRPTIPSLLQYLGLSGSNLTEGLDLEQLRVDHPVAFRKWLQEAAHNYNAGLNQVAKFLRPQTIIISSRFPESVSRQIIDGISFEPFHPPRYNDLPQPEVILSSLEPEMAEIIGASLLPVHHLIY